MTARIAASTAEQQPRQVAQIALVAAILDCQESGIRRMLRNGELEGHGKTDVRL